MGACASTFAEQKAIPCLDGGAVFRIALPEESAAGTAFKDEPERPALVVVGDPTTESSLRLEPDRRTANVSTDQRPKPHVKPVVRLQLVALGAALRDRLGCSEQEYCGLLAAALASAHSSHPEGWATPAAAVTALATRPGPQHPALLRAAWPEPRPHVVHLVLWRSDAQGGSVHGAQLHILHTAHAPNTCSSVPRLPGHAHVDGVDVNSSCSTLAFAWPPPVLPHDVCYGRRTAAMLRSHASHSAVLYGSPFAATGGVGEGSTHGSQTARTMSGNMSGMVLAGPFSSAQLPGGSSRPSKARADTILDEAPSIMTLISLQEGTFVSQNIASQEYFGRLQAPPQGLHDTCGDAAGPSAPVHLQGALTSIDQLPVVPVVHPSVRLLLELLLLMEQESMDLTAPPTGSPMRQLVAEVVVAVFEQRVTWQQVVKVPLQLAPVLHKLSSSWPGAALGAQPSSTTCAASSTLIRRPSLPHVLLSSAGHTGLVAPSSHHSGSPASGIALPPSSLPWQGSHEDLLTSGHPTCRSMSRLGQQTAPPALQRADTEPCGSTAPLPQDGEGALTAVAEASDTLEPSGPLKRAWMSLKQRIRHVDSNGATGSSDAASAEVAAVGGSSMSSGLGNRETSNSGLEQGAGGLVCNWQAPHQGMRFPPMSGPFPEMADLLSGDHATGIPQSRHPASATNLGAFTTLDITPNSRRSTSRLLNTAGRPTSARLTSFLQLRADTMYTAATHGGALLAGSGIRPSDSAPILAQMLANVDGRGSPRRTPPSAGQRPPGPQRACTSQNLFIAGGAGIGVGAPSLVRGNTQPLPPAAAAGLRSVMSQIATAPADMPALLDPSSDSRVTYGDFNDPRVSLGLAWDTNGARNSPGSVFRQHSGQNCGPSLGPPRLSLPQPTHTAPPLDGPARPLGSLFTVKKGLVDMTEVQEGSGTSLDELPERRTSSHTHALTALGMSMSEEVPRTVDAAPGAVGLDGVDTALPHMNSEPDPPEEGGFGGASASQQPSMPTHRVPSVKSMYRPLSMFGKESCMISPHQSGDNALFPAPSLLKRPSTPQLPDVGSLWGTARSPEPSIAQAGHPQRLSGVWTPDGTLDVAAAVASVRDELLGGPFAYHEVFLKQVLDPGTERPALLLVQHDVTEQVQLEAELAEVTDAQLGMLSEIFPRHVIEQLGATGAMDVPNLAQTARRHAHATLLFMDVVDFTAMSKRLPPEQVIAFINNLFSAFDLLVSKHGVQKIDTMGDAFLLGSGILAPDTDGFNVVDDSQDAALCARRVFRCAQEMIYVASQMTMPHSGQPVRIRVGINSGPCVSGLIGLRLPKWTVLGDTVNLAARMEQMGVPGKIQVTATTRALLGPDVTLVPTGGVNCKGQGVIETYLWELPPGWTPPLLGAPELGSPAPPQPVPRLSHGFLDTLTSMELRQVLVPPGSGLLPEPRLNHWSQSMPLSIHPGVNGTPDPPRASLTTCNTGSSFTLRAGQPGYMGHVLLRQASSMQGEMLHTVVPEVNSDLSLCALAEHQKGNSSGTLGPEAARQQASGSHGRSQRTQQGLGSCITLCNSSGGGADGMPSVFKAMDGVDGFQPTPGDAEGNGSGGDVPPGGRPLMLAASDCVTGHYRAPDSVRLVKDAMLGGGAPGQEEVSASLGPAFRVISAPQVPYGQLGSATRVDPATAASLDCWQNAADRHGSPRVSPRASPRDASGATISPERDSATRSGSARSNIAAHFDVLNVASLDSGMAWADLVASTSNGPRSHRSLRRAIEHGALGAPFLLSDAGTGYGPGSLGTLCLLDEECIAEEEEEDVHFPATTSGDIGPATPTITSMVPQVAPRGAAAPQSGSNTVKRIGPPSSASTRSRQAMSNRTSQPGISGGSGSMGTMIMVAGRPMKAPQQQRLSDMNGGQDGCGGGGSSAGAAPSSSMSNGSHFLKLCQAVRQRVPSVPDFNALVGAVAAAHQPSRASAHKNREAPTTPHH